MITTLLFLISTAYAGSAKFDCTDLPLKPVIEQTHLTSATSDFPQRNALPQTEKPLNEWSFCCGTYGPCALPYPKVVFPNSANRVEWSRIRIIEAAKKYIGLPYKHHHIPAMGGMDCSNFTAFVYNYSLGVRFSSRVDRQALEAGRKLPKTAMLVPGDLLFIYDDDRQRISHVAIYISPTEIIDSIDSGIRIRPFTGWYKTHFAWARRVIE